MKWFRKRPRVEVHHVLDMTFLGEQDGETEKEVKRRLMQVFATTTTLHHAYLVRAKYDSSQQIRVVLALDAGPGGHVVLREKAQEVFAKMFNSAESLDILFPSQEQKQRISTVAKPFYEK